MCCQMCVCQCIAYICHVHTCVSGYLSLKRWDSYAVTLSADYWLYLELVDVQKVSRI